MLGKLQNYPFVDTKDIISLEDAEGNIFSLKKDIFWEYFLIDTQNNKKEINYDFLQQMFLRKAANRKIILMSSNDNLKEFNHRTTKLFSNNINENNILNEISRNTSALVYKPFLYYYETFTQKVSRITKFDKEINRLTRIWNQEDKIPKSIKRFFFKEDNYNKFVISLNKHQTRYTNDIGKYLNYDKNLKLIFDINIEDFEQKLFYAKLKNVIDFERKIVYYSMDENFNIKGENLCS